MSDIPPKHTPDMPYETPESGSGLVAMYNAASHANAESFPVLKAFQDYIEAERAQARKRVMQLSIFFAVLMGVVVTGFLTAGIFMLRNMSDVQTKLLDVALASKEAPPPQPVVISSPPASGPSPLFEASVREISQAATELRSSLDKKMDGVSDIAAKVQDRVEAQDSELGKLRDELKNMQAQSERLNTELSKLKRVPKPVLTPSSSAFAAAVTPAAPVTAPVNHAPPMPKAHAAVRQPGLETLAGSPPAHMPPPLKEPPVTPPGVTPPTAPAGRLATAIPLKTKHTGTIPWRVLIPD